MNNVLAASNGAVFFMRSKSDRIFYTTKCIEKTSVKIAADKAKLAFLKNNNFYSVLRNKLHWGVSPEQ